MDSRTCSVNNCNYLIFETENKCILHCTKNEKNNWYTLDEKKKLWNPEKIQLFWKEIRKTLYQNKLNQQPKKSISFFKIVFPIFEEYLFDDSNSVDILSGNFLNNVSNSTKFKLSILFDNCIFLDDLDFYKYDFNHRVKFINCKCLKNLNFNSCIFGKELELGININKKLNFLSCDFYSTKLLLCGSIKVDFKTITASESLFLHITDNSCITIRDSKIKHFNIINIEEEEEELTLIDSLLEKILPTNNTSHNKINIKDSKIISIEFEDLCINNFIIEKTNIDKYANLHFAYFDYLEINGIKLNGNISIRGSYFQNTCDAFNNNDSVILKHIELIGNSKITISDIVSNNLELDSLSLIGTNNLNISNLNLKQLSITNCILNNAIINNIQFQKQSNTFISNSQLNSCHFLNVRWENTNLDSLDAESCNQIKHSYDSRGNIIEANKFYATEMRARSKEKKSWKDNIIFKLHYLSSNHSQDWFRALLWIVFFTILFAIIMCDKLPTSLDFITITYYDLKNKIIILHDKPNFIAILLMSLMSLVLVLPIIKKYIKLNLILGLSTIFLLISYFNCCQNANGSELVSFLNFSSLFKDTGKTFSIFMLNLVQGYLVYQFIVSIRQNTRRK